MPLAPTGDEGVDELTIRVTVVLANGTAVLRADPPALEIPKGSSDVRLTFELHDQTKGGWTFLTKASHDANGDHYNGIEIHRDNGEQFIHPCLAPDTRRSLSVLCENTRPGTFKYDIWVENPNGEKISLDPTITNRGR